MRLKVLGRRLAKLGPTGYRGTYRENPCYCPELPEEHEANGTFLDYVAEAGEDGFVANLQLAQRLVKACADLKPPRHYEIVEATVCDEEVQLGQQLLGFDVSYKLHFSLLAAADIFADNGTSSRNQAEHEVLTIEPLLRLMKLHFRPRVNDNGLFEERKTAEFFLECAKALHSTCRNLWEEDTVIDGLCVVALHLVTKK
jgi:hypothetical protein